MPELPEVETTRRGVEPWVLGKTVTAVNVRDSRLRWPVEAPAGLVGQPVVAVNRRAKYLLFTFPSGTLIVHLGMSGSLRILSPEAPYLKHDHVEVCFGGRAMRLHDPRRFGSVLFQPGDDPYRHTLLRNLGVEPLGNELSGEYLFAKSRGRRMAVKNLIMDGKVVVGVGNIYAAEALFLAGIRPGMAAGRVNRAGYEQLTAAIRQVLSAAVTEGGTTLRDFVNSDGNPGYFAQSLYVYGRQGEPCRVCGQVLKLKILGQRSTVYCPDCQTLRAHRALALRLPS